MALTQQDEGPRRLSGLPQAPYSLHRTFAGAQELRREPSGALEAAGLGAAAGSAQAEKTRQRYGHKHITKPQKRHALMSTTPSTHHAPPRCRSDPGAPQGSPATPDRLSRPLHRIRKRLARQQRLIHAGRWIGRNQHLTARSRSRAKKLIDKSLIQPFAQPGSRGLAGHSRAGGLGIRRGAEGKRHTCTVHEG